MKEFDTIAAISTALGGGIAIIRVSGTNAIDIVSKICVNKNKEKIDNFKHKEIVYSYIIDENQEKIDEVLISFMKSPNSYTCENVIEINSHGGAVVTNMIMKELIKKGCRMAEPGEFTKRAFLNGRIDISEAQGVMDIISAKTEAALKYGIAQLSGEFKYKIEYIRNKLLELIAQIEVTVDYPEDDIEELTANNVINEIKKLKNELEIMEKELKKGKILRDGLSTIIIGKPNVGKSSLMNRLLMEEKVIVTDIPGTTRDLIEEYINIEGIPIKLIDTAGIREVYDIVEKKGIEKTYEKLKLSNLVIYMIDMTKEIDDDDRNILKLIKNENTIILLNKLDKCNSDYKELENFSNIIKISALENKGIEELKSQIVDMVNCGELTMDNNELNSKIKIEEGIYNTIVKFEETIDTLTDLFAIDLATIDLKEAYYFLGEVLGDNIDDDIINKIFSKFCVGK